MQQDVQAGALREGLMEIHEQRSIVTRLATRDLERDDGLSVGTAEVSAEALGPRT